MGFISDLGIGGTVDGSFFKAPTWVDKSLPPGRTNQGIVYGKWSSTIKSYITTSFFFLSPNLVWFAVAAATYYCFPYDIDAAKDGILKPWLLYRFCVNLFVTFSYFGFWSLSLYKWSWATRKFNPDNNPTAGRMFHNVWYSIMGVVQWTFIEAMFLFAYANSRLEYKQDSELFHGDMRTVYFIGWCLFIPLWRDFHFYFAHRFLHLRGLYKYVHSLHHRNNDIEPFSGLCMHPIEHLYYFSCFAPSLISGLSPFILMWNGIHLLISPAASHSGWEDHFQSDQFHYLHHAKFECNYGTSGPPMDKMFGTFRDKLGPSPVENVSDDIKEVTQIDFLAGGLSLGSALTMRLDQALFNFLAYGILIGFIIQFHFQKDGLLWSFLLPYGPILSGLLVLNIFGDSKSMFWPFHKTSFVGELGFHIIISYFMAVYPVQKFAEMVMLGENEPGLFDFALESVGQTAAYQNITSLIFS
eukprot:m.6765 g.6765  ORF g.6765 m.6765 type:complete len:469 (-) comp3580_c0_seq1:124-1530(-)